MAAEDDATRSAQSGTTGGGATDPGTAALAAALRDRCDGEVAFDEYAQVLYATDGSIYGARPAGVVCPMDTDDVREAVRAAAEHDTPVLPRGAGSSLAGQAVGPGCVVLDLSRHMDDVLDVDPGARRATVQPGVVQDHLDAELAPHGLKFAPDPASSNRATIGGGIGNNSTGAHSVRYGITDAYTEELRVVLADGSLIHTRPVVVGSDEWDDIVAKDDLEARIYRTVLDIVDDNADEIAERYPTLKRSVSGYNLHKVVTDGVVGGDAVGDDIDGDDAVGDDVDGDDAVGDDIDGDVSDGERVVNLSKLFVGAEGTLGVVVEATVSLVTVPEGTALALYCFDDLVAALRAVPEALEFDVSAVELMDDEVFRLAADSDGYADYAEPIPDGSAAALLLEWDSELCDDFRAAVDATNAHFVDDGEAFDVLEAFTDEAQDDLWKLRKAAIPLLMGLEGDPKPYPFIEDATVPPEELAEYVQSFEDVLDAHDTSAAYFAHAGSGTLHIRPILNLKAEDGVETMHSITADVTDLVLKHHGAFSGEHGDGMARTEFNPKMYGPELWRAFKELKTAFDPDWLMHPGNVVYRDGPDDVGPGSDDPGDVGPGSDDPGDVGPGSDGPGDVGPDGAGPDNRSSIAERGVGADMREHLRYGPTYSSVEPATMLDFDDEGGFSHLVELCNGCGTCRQTDSDTMCPTYRASKEEIQTTRGRANMLRAAISGDLPEDELYSERFQEEVLDLCVGCKGCASDCPTGVDMAKLKAEVKHQYHEREGASLRERAFAHVDLLSRVGSRLAPWSNHAQRIPGVRDLLEERFGIAAERELPRFAEQSFVEWFDERGGCRLAPGDAHDQVLLFPDTYTNYSYPAPGTAAVRVLEAAGIYVRVPRNLKPSGRAAYSKGMLDLAEKRARHNVGSLASQCRNGWSVVFVEPSDAVMLQDEYRDLLSGQDVRTVSQRAFGVLEFLDVHGHDAHLGVDPDDPSLAHRGEHLTYHGHCNQKATGKDHHAVGVLRRVGYDVDPLDSGCCGMAGSFGYEAEHYDLSQAIGRILFRQVADSPGEAVVAPGASCRTQLGDRDGHDHPPHPIEKVAEALQ